MPRAGLARDRPEALFIPADKVGTVATIATLNNYNSYSKIATVATVATVAIVANISPIRISVALLPPKDELT